MSQEFKVDWNPINLLSRHIGEFRSLLSVADRDLEKFGNSHKSEANTLISQMRGEIRELESLLEAIRVAKYVPPENPLDEIPF